MQFLLFYCGQHCFALDTSTIVEVFPKVDLRELAGQTPDYLVGLFNYGGKPIPVIDLCQLIEKRACQEAMHNRLILIEKDHQRLALLAEKVTEMVQLEMENFPETGLKIESLPFLGGIYQKGERSIQFFDLDRFLDRMQPHLATHV